MVLLTCQSCYHQYISHIALQFITINKLNRIAHILGMPPTRTSTSRSQASNISEVTKTARHLGAITVVDAQKNMNLPRKGDGATTAERSQTSAAAYSTSGVIGNFPHPSQSRSGAGRLVPPSTYATITANQRGPPSVAASSRRSVYNDSNAGPSWRGNTPAPYIGGPATNRSTAMGNGRKAEVLPRREFKKGVIIRAPLHEQDYQGASRQSNVTAADAHNKTESRFGTIYTKYRKMIVVECYQDHYIAVPLFTHGGRGLQYKRKPEEYIRLVHLSDSRSMSSLCFFVFECVPNVDKLHGDLSEADSIVSQACRTIDPRSPSRR